MSDADTQVDDDTCITLAVLHGAEFMQGGGEYSRHLWYIVDAGVQNSVYKFEVDKRGTAGFPSRHAIARAYCIVNGLI